MKLAKTLAATFDDGRVVALTDATVMALRHMLTVYDPARGPAHITAIKFVRLVHNIGLREAKDIVDALRTEPHLMD